MNEKKHIDYSAADIERYHKGLMTAGEMNAMEKAALDDPFLADAIEGYSMAGIQADSDISLLHKKLEERVKEGKIVPVKKISYTWLRIAAAFVIIAGAGLLAYNYIFQNKTQDVATVEPKDTTDKQPAFHDTAKRKTADTVPDTNGAGRIESLTGETEDKKNKSTTIAKAKESEKAGLIGKPSPDSNYPVPEKSAEAVTQNTEALEIKADSVKNVAAPESKSANGIARSNPTNDFAKAKKNVSQDKEKTLNEAGYYNLSGKASNNQFNYFRGQVTDANNSPLPFANVTIVPDNIGTYTDVKGNFVLISPDSVLDVKVRSVGFENNNVRLQNKVNSNSIVLQQDTKNIPSTVLNSSKANTERKRQDNMTVEEPEPADGWYNYDTYLANNIKISDEIKTKTNSSSEVELSFDVNKSGEPVNIKVEKSVCKECDEEAIRLLKEGPKWKKKKKDKRAKVSVGFSQE